MNNLINIDGPTHSAYDISTDINSTDKTRHLEPETRFWYHHPNGIMFTPVGFVENDSLGYPKIRKNENDRQYITFISRNGDKTIAYLDDHIPSFSVIDSFKYYSLYDLSLIHISEPTRPR